MDRRTFLETGAAVTAGALPWSWPRPPRLRPVGVQLYTLRTEMEKSVEATLARVAEIGYREVEFAGYFDRSPQQIRDTLRETGLSAPAFHVPLENLRADADRVFDTAQQIGHQYVVVPWLAEADRVTIAAIGRVTESLNHLGARAKGVGLQLAYHNHDFEFQRVEGRLLFDALLEDTDPDLVQVEMDLFWITKGGADPLAYFTRYPSRFPLVHVKDMDADGQMVDVGAGTIDFRTIFARREQAGIRHYFVEHDRPSDVFGSVEASFRFLSHLE